MAPDVKTGMYCYEAFFARTRPCEECPAKNISRNINRTMEIFNPVLNVWTEADASLIRWGEKKMHVCCPAMTLPNINTTERMMENGCNLHLW